MPEEVVVQKPAPAFAPARSRRASWGAIFGGAFVTVVIQLMLTLLGVGVGIATSQSQTTTSSQAWLTASGIWFLVTGLVSIWVGAYVAGRLCGGPRRSDGLFHGLVTWSVAMVGLLALLETTFAGALGGTTQLIAAAVAPVSPSVQNVLTSAAHNTPATVQNGQTPLAPTGRAHAPQPGAPEAQPGTGQTIDWTILWGCFALFLGLLTAAWAGWAGAASLPRPVETVVETNA